MRAGEGREGRRAGSPAGPVRRHPHLPPGHASFPRAQGWRHLTSRPPVPSPTGGAATEPLLPCAGHWDLLEALPSGHLDPELTGPGVCPRRRLSAQPPAHHVCALLQAEQQLVDCAQDFNNHGCQGYVPDPEGAGAPLLPHRSLLSSLAPDAPPPAAPAHGHTPGVPRPERGSAVVPNPALPPRCPPALTAVHVTSSAPKASGQSHTQVSGQPFPTLDILSSPAWPAVRDPCTKAVTCSCPKAVSLEGLPKTVSGIYVLMCLESVGAVLAHACVRPAPVPSPSSSCGPVLGRDVLGLHQLRQQPTPFTTGSVSTCRVAGPWVQAALTGNSVPWVRGARRQEREGRGGGATLWLVVQPF